MNHGLVLAILNNAALLLAMVLAFDALTARQSSLATRLRKEIAGVAIGLIGIAMIYAAVPVGRGVVLDARSVLLATSGLFLGVWPTVIAMVMTSVYRLQLGGGAEWTGVLTILLSGTLGMAWRRLFRFERLTLLHLWAMGLVVHGAVLAAMWTLPSGLAVPTIAAMALPVMGILPLATMALGFVFLRRLRVEAAVVDLARSEARFRLLAENARDIIYRYELSGRVGFSYVSPAAESITGYAPADFLADPELGARLIHPKDRHLLTGLREGEPSGDQSLLLRLIRRDGEMRWVEQRNTFVRDERGKVVAVEAFVRDITDSKQADAMMRMALKAANQGLYDLNVQTGEAVVSEEYARMLGYDPADFHETNEAWIERLHPDDRKPVAAVYRDYIAGLLPEYSVEFRQRTRGGDWRWILSLGSVVSWDAAGMPLRMVGTHTDISALKSALGKAREAHSRMELMLAEAAQSRLALLSLVEDQQAAERRLTAAQQLAQSTLDSLKDHICVLDARGVIIAVNDAWCEFGLNNGARPDAILTGADYLAVCDRAEGPDGDLARAFASGLRDVIAGRRDAFSMEYPCHSPDEQRWFSARVTRFAFGGPQRVAVTHENITERRAAENQIRRLTQILEASQAAARVGGWELDLTNRDVFWTGETYRIFGLRPEEHTPTLESMHRLFAGESAVAFDGALREAAERGIARDLELTVVTAAGERKSVQLTTVVMSSEGMTTKISGAIQDITSRKEAERERLELTAQLHQSQKLESLGSLAGGVAHDINNVLAAILSLASGHRRQIDESDPLASSLDIITNACIRGRSVVRSLLYFARKDIETRGPVDLNRVAREIVQLLDNTTLKRIRITTDFESPLPLMDGDEAALSHAVMNLCVNAVDAMPQGGSLAVRTHAREDGFIEISVRDSGIGMSSEVRQKAVEPFFTTKPTGKGTGLGLSMVYGAVQAHGGTFTLTSNPGEGTEVVLAFPSTHAMGVDSAVPASRSANPPASARRLRFLLVDDDELIRSSIAALLEMDGHQVHLAAGGAEAISLFEDGLDVDLVILDMNMPGLNGPQTLERLLRLRPDQLVLMCSGNAEESMALLATKNRGVLAIQKPFTADELDAKLAALGLA